MMPATKNSNPPSTDNRKIYRVSEINRLIKATLEDSFGFVWVEGELSNVSRPGSGHIYFTLKDETAQIASVLFRGDQRGLTVEIKDGRKVRVYGQLTVYEASGKYQIIVRKIEDAGKGSLQEAFEALKKKLAQEGLFDASRKKPLPMLPRHVGIVTSPTGAAIRDILNILDRRFPNLHILLAPVKVQGEGAAGEIAAAIDHLNRLGGLDVMIVGRGGGSLEDLWCFNEEIVARAIARSAIPVISAVGHEIDFTISDFVADLRAPTPSAAAELMVGRKESFEQALQQQQARLGRALRQTALELKARVAAVAGHYVFREPLNLVRQHTQRVDGLRVKLAAELKGVFRQQQQKTDELGLRLAHGVELSRKTWAQDLRRLQSQLNALSPLSVLDRGFSITRRADGAIIRSIEQVAAGDALVTRVSKGEIESKVILTKRGEEHGGKTDR